MQREVRGFKDELRSASQTVHTRLEDQGDAGADLEILLENQADMDKVLDRKVFGQKESTGSRRRKEEASTTAAAPTPDPSFEEGACVIITWATHNGQHAKIVGKNGDKFLSVFFKDQTTEWIPIEYATPNDCPPVKKHDCVNVTWVSKHHSQLGKVLQVKNYEGDNVCDVKFDDEKTEWIPIAALNYSFKKCPNISIPEEKDDESKSNSSDRGKNSSKGKKSDQSNSSTNSSSG